MQRRHRESLTHMRRLFHLTPYKRLLGHAMVRTTGLLQTTLIRTTRRRLRRREGPGYQS